MSKMAKNLKDMLAKKLAENNLRHAAAQQEVEFDAGRVHTKLHTDAIDPNPYQPRRTFPQAELEALASSIAEVGLLQPVSVRQVGERYQLVAGERRLRAHKLLGRPSIEAIVLAAEDADMAILALSENIDRADLADFEIGKALRRIEDLFPTKKKLAESLGMNREDMYRYYAFESLPAHLQVKLDANPRLLSRAAAADIKRVVQQADNQELAATLLDQAWEMLEQGDLDQTKVAPFVARGLLSPGPGAAEPESVINLARNGKQIGSISRNRKNLLVKLQSDALSDSQVTRLQRFLEELVAAEV